MSGGATGPGLVQAVAPAKINPWLEILGRRPDGYHELDTWMVAIDLCDRVAVRANDSGEIALEIRGPCASPDIRPDPTNLCWRAAAQVLETVRRERPDRARSGLSIQLEKNIPSQAGLGGASTDAAATWLASRAALGLDADGAGNSAAAQVLETLGSDCVFFARAADTGLARCTGRGERVTVAPPIARPWFVALLTPDALCPTASVYAAFGKALRRTGELHRLPPTWYDMPASAVRRFLFNELEAVALEAIPALVPWRKALDSGGGEHFRLSGSGSSFYGLFDTRDEAQSALDRVVDEARRRGLRERGRWITRPTGFGAKLSSPALSEDR